MLPERDQAYYLDRDLTGLVLQYLNERGYAEAAHGLESEAQYYFDMKYCQHLFVEGKWDLFMTYVVNFVGKDYVEDHKVLFFEILKQKYLYYLDQANPGMATQVLKDEVRPFFQLADDNMDQSLRRVQIYNELASLLTADDFRKHSNVAWLENGLETRKQIFPHIAAYLAEKIPSIRSSLSLPEIPAAGRLETLIQESIYWQLGLTAEQAKTPATIKIATLFTDHNDTIAQPQPMTQTGLNPLFQSDSTPNKPTPKRRPSQEIKSTTSKKKTKQSEDASDPLLSQYSRSNYGAYSQPGLDYYAGSYGMNPGPFGMAPMVSPYNMYPYAMDPRLMQANMQMYRTPYPAPQPNQMLMQQYLQQQLLAQGPAAPLDPSLPGMAVPNLPPLATPQPPRIPDFPL